MTAAVGRRGLVSRLRHPQTTVRWRLTLLYGGLFLVSGAVLLAVTYTLVDNASVNGSGIQRTFIQANGPSTAFLRPPPDGPAASQARIIPPSLAARVRRLVRSQPGKIAVALGRSDQRIADLHQLVEESAIALAVMALICGALGWMVAGRVLAPLRTMTAATREISEANLDRRLALAGPRDELRRLADTIDGLLGRLEGAFDAQRHFVANASHELRTPLTAARALLEMVISDPGATVDTYRTTCEQVLEESAQQEQLIDALLTLAQGQRGIDQSEHFDLAVIAGGALEAHRVEAAARGVHLDATLEPAPMSGDPRLVERLVSNLLDNAVRHNVACGRMRVSVEARDGRPIIAVANTGSVVPEAEVERLLRPFQRLDADRVGHREGLGLGLSIVAAVAAAHDATLDVRAAACGGLEIVVRFPACAVRTLGAGNGSAPALEAATSE
jgi:signal transduction histidine kinase